MPFRRQPDGSYISEHGRKYTAKQVRLYGMTGGFKHQPNDPKKVFRRKPAKLNSESKPNR